MCLIIVKSQEQTFDNDILLAGHLRNPHGMGFCYHDGKRVIIRRYFDFDEFERDINQYTPDRPSFVHFRYKVSGQISYGNTQPLPVTRGNKPYNKRVIKTRLAIADNGICQLSTMTKKQLSRYSDTRIIAQTILPNYGNNYAAFLNKIIAVVSSRFVTMDGGGEVQTFGKFYEVDGLLYSNLLWQPQPSQLTFDYGDDADYHSYYDPASNATYYGYFCAVCGCYLVDGEIKNGVCAHCINDATIADPNATKRLEFCDNCGNTIVDNFTAVGVFNICDYCGKDNETLEYFKTFNT